MANEPQIYFQFSEETLERLGRGSDYALDIQAKTNETLQQAFEAMGSRTASLETLGWLRSRISEIETIGLMTGDDNLPELELARTFENYFSQQTYLNDYTDLKNFDTLEESAST